MMSYFNITINMTIITDPAFSRVLKIFNIFFNHHTFFVKMFLSLHYNTIYFLDHTINKVVNNIFKYL